MNDHGRTSLEWYKTAVGWQVGLSTSAIAGLSVLAYKLHGMIGDASLVVLVPIVLFGFSATAGVLLHFHVIDRIASSELLEDARRRSTSWVQAKREEAQKEVKDRQKVLEEKRSSVQRFHRYCVIGFHVAAVSCVLVVLPVLLFGLLGRDAPAPAPCCPYALIEGQGICTLAAPAQDEAGPDVTVDIGADPAARPGTSPEPDQEAQPKPPLASPAQGGREDRGNSCPNVPGGGSP